MRFFCLRHVWRNIQGYGTRTAICDIAEGTDMGLETESVPGLSCSLYGGVDLGGLQGSDRKVGRSGEIVCVRCSFRNTESFKIMEDSFGSVSRYLPETKL